MDLHCKVTSAHHDYTETCGDRVRQSHMQTLSLKAHILSSRVIYTNSYADHGMFIAKILWHSKHRYSYAMLYVQHVFTGVNTQIYIQNTSGQILVHVHTNLHVWKHN